MPPMTSPFPTGLDDTHIRHEGGVPAGTGALMVLGLLIAASLAGLLGGTPAKPVSARSPEGVLVVSMPRVVRSGMFFETRIRVAARRPLRDATIAMPHSLWRSITINSQVPQASEEEYKDGAVRLHFGPLPAGDAIDLKIDAQINPNLFLGNRGDVALLDREREIVRLPLIMTVLP